MAKGKPRRDGGPEADERQLDEYWLDDLFQAVEMGEDFTVFALALQDNARRHGTTWLNADLDAYLGAIAAYVHERGPFIDAADAALPRQNPWKVAAEVLYNARHTRPSSGTARAYPEGKRETTSCMTDRDGGARLLR